MAKSDDNNSARRARSTRGNAGGKKRGPFGRLCSKLGPIESGDPLWYNSFEQVKRQKTRKFKLVVMSIYLLIVLATLVLHPYLVLVLTGGLRPLIGQPRFAFIFKYYVACLTAVRENSTSQKIRAMQPFIEDFNSILDANDKILFLSLFSIPVNVFFTLSLAFRFPRQSSNIRFAITHSVLGLVNMALVAGMYFIYKIEGLDRRPKKFDCPAERMNERFAEINLTKQADVHKGYTHVFPAIGLLGAAALLHILLGMFVVIRYKINPQNVKPNVGVTKEE